MGKSNADKIAKEFADILRKKFKNRLKKAILFGSHARGDSTEGSDYDILVVVDKRKKADENIQGFNRVLGKINYVYL